MKPKRETVIAVVLAVALVGGGYAIGRGTQKSVVMADAQSAAVAPRQPGSLPSFADLAARVAPAVVNRSFRFHGFTVRLPSSRASSGVRGPDRGLSFAKTG
jgi:hypothetical protein